MNVVANLIAGAIGYLLGIAAGYFTARPELITASLAVLLLLPALLLSVVEWKTDRRRRVARRAGDVLVTAVSALGAALMGVLTLGESPVYLKFMFLGLAGVCVFLATLAGGQAWSAFTEDDRID